MMDLLDGKNAVAIYEVMFDECGAAEAVERYFAYRVLVRIAKEYPGTHAS
jgi:hypothetical protein